MEMRRGGKKVGFQGGTLFFENIIYTTCFYLIFSKNYSRKNEFSFSKQNTCKLKDLELCGQLINISCREKSKNYNLPFIGFILIIF